MKRRRHQRLHMRTSKLHKKFVAGRKKSRGITRSKNGIFYPTVNGIVSANKKIVGQSREDFGLLSLSTVYRIVDDIKTEEGDIYDKATL